MYFIFGALPQTSVEDKHTSYSPLDIINLSGRFRELDKLYWMQPVRALIQCSRDIGLYDLSTRTLVYSLSALQICVTCSKLLVK